MPGGADEIAAPRRIIFAPESIYSSSFNVFAVISGIYLWRGHPWYVKWVTRAAGFYAGAFCAVVSMAPFLFPVDLGVLELRLHPAGVIVGTVATIGVVVFLVWVYRELRQSPVLAAYTVAGYSPGQFWVAPLCGAMLASVVPRLWQQAYSVALIGEHELALVRCR